MTLLVLERGAVFMVEILSQLNFQGFGVVLPERTETDRLTVHGSTEETLSLVQSDTPIYLCKSECWMCCAEGTVTLSVSHDNINFRHFYLDRPVSVNRGVYFSLSPFLTQATARIAFNDAPSVAGRCSISETLYVEPRFQITKLHTFFYQERERGFLFPGESHTMLELNYVDQGSMHSVADGKDLLLEQGDMVLYAPNQWHMQYADMDVAPRFVTFSFDACGCDLSALFNRIIKPPQQAVNLLQLLLRERECSDLYASDLMISMLTQVLLLLQRSAADSAGKLTPSNTLHSENAIIRRAQQYIVEHIRDKLTVPLVAHKVDVSPSYLTALFHKNLQISPGEYIRRIKLQESKQMIRENDMNFTESAAALQYSTVHHFSRQFKEKFGITPSEYAKSVR